jgi:glycosyltransferase involved in cell wall biosynthesis
VEGDCDILVEGKMYPIHVGYKSLVVDMCDYTLDGFARIDGFEKILTCANAVVCSSDFLRQKVEAWVHERGLAAKVFCIRDPALSYMHEPRWLDRHQLNLGWFGNGFNFRLGNWDRVVMGLLAKKHLFRSLGYRRINIKIFSDLKDIEYCKNDESFLKVSVVPFRASQLENFICSCDIIVLPIDHFDVYTMSKSHNRLVETIACGKPFVVGAIPEYLLWKEYGEVTSEYVEGIIKICRTPKKYMAKIKKAQQIVQEKYSPKRIAEEWLGLFRCIASKIGVVIG